MTKKPVNTGKIQDGKFQKGTSGNPKGRPKGSRNQSTLAAEKILDGQVEAITQKAIELALDGDTTALRLVLERILPAKKERPILLSLPDIVSTHDLTKAVNHIIISITHGAITSSEGQSLLNQLDILRKAIETQELEKRIEALEESHS